MKNFVSYTDSYDHYVGMVSISDLPVDKQDEFICAILEDQNDFRELSLSHNVLKAQVEGLWAISRTDFVCVGIIATDTRHVCQDCG